jgi:class 3 adenylate cyclase
VTGKSCRPISTSENGVIPFRARSQAFADLLPLLFGSAAHGVSREINEEHSETPLYLRIGLSAGEPIEEHGDLFGKAVQLAARLCAHAEPARILIDQVVLDQWSGKQVPFSDLGEVRLKGFDHAIKAYEVQWTQA